MVFLTGLSGSGKSTIASHLSSKLGACTVLDGDIVRKTFGDTPHGANGHEVTINRLIDLSLTLFKSNKYVVGAFVAPRADLRERVKLALTSQGIRFIEVYISADLETCESRDPKGLYRRYHSGEKLHLAGLNEVYDVPQTPDVICQTANHTVEENISDILKTVHVQTN